MTTSANGTNGNKRTKLFVIAAGLLLVGIYVCVTVNQRNALLHSVHAGTESVSASGGYIIEHDGFYYYANPADENCLYRSDAALKNREKLSDHANRSPYICLSAVGNRVYWMQSIAQENGAAQRLYAYDTKTGEQIEVFDKNIISYVVADDGVYCETASPTQTYRVRPNGSASEAVGNKHPNALAVRKWAAIEDVLFSITQEGIGKYDFANGQAMGFQGYSADFAVDGNKIYSINYHNRCALEQYDAETMSFADRKTVVSKNVEAFTLFDKTLVYATENDLLWVKQMGRMGRTFLGFGRNPIICGQYLFCMDGKDRIRYLGKFAAGTL